MLASCAQLLCAKKWPFSLLRVVAIYLRNPCWHHGARATISIACVTSAAHLLAPLATTWLQAHHMKAMYQGESNVSCGQARGRGNAWSWAAGPSTTALRLAKQHFFVYPDSAPCACTPGKVCCTRLRSSDQLLTAAGEPMQHHTDRRHPRSKTTGPPVCHDCNVQRLKRNLS